MDKYKQNIISAPFLDNPKKWTIYRRNTEEVTFEIKGGLIVNISNSLTPLEVLHIKKDIIETIPLSEEEKIISHGARGVSDLTISKILSIPLYEVKPIITKYWENKMKNRKWKN